MSTIDTCIDMAIDAVHTLLSYSNYETLRKTLKTATKAHVTSVATKSVSGNIALETSRFLNPKWRTLS